MIYIGKYYEDKGYNTDLNIPRYHLDDTRDHEYCIVIVNNITKETVSQSENLINDSSSDYFYTFSGFDTSVLTDGEYTISLFEDENQVFDGLLAFRNEPKIDASVYNTATKYIVYE